MSTTTTATASIDRSALLRDAWTRARSAAEAASESARRHIGTAMRAAWAAARPAPKPDVEPCATYVLGKHDRRCRGWERVIREAMPLPAPEDVHGAGDLPGCYAPDRGSEELFGLDAVMQGEENHHRRARGWTYWLYVRHPATNAIVPLTPTAARKALIKKAILAGRIDLPPEVLKGSGDIAGMVRLLAAIRAGLPIAELSAAE